MLVPSRSLDSVKHFPLLYNGHVYSFGVGEFSSIQELVEHFDNYPVIAGRAGECIQIAKKLIYSGWRCICRIQWSTKTEHSITQLYYHTCGQLLMSKHVVDVWCVSDISRDGHIRPMCKHNSWIMNFSWTPGYFTNDQQWSVIRNNDRVVWLQFILLQRLWITDEKYIGVFCSSVKRHQQQHCID